MEHAPDQYRARYEVEYPEQLDRLSTLLRIPFAVPFLLVASLMPIAPALIVSLAVDGIIDADSWSYGAAGAFFLPLVLMIVFRRKYPRWWFNFVLEFTRFEARIFAYVSLLTDQYPSTDAGQTVRLDLDYPDAEQLNRFLPIVKWLLLIPHYVVLVVLAIVSVVAIILAWFAILASGRYPRPLFDYVVGVNRYALRVTAYGLMLITDRYPPFRLAP